MFRHLLRHLQGVLGAFCCCITEIISEQMRRIGSFKLNIDMFVRKPFPEDGLLVRVPE